MAALRWVDEDEAMDRSPRSTAPAQSQVAPPRIARAERPRRQTYVSARPRTYFWRRMVAVVGIAALGAVAWSLGGRVVAGASVRPGSVHCSAGLVPVPAGAVGTDGLSSTCGMPYVARPGDTIWQVAVRYDQGGDPRALEDELEAEISGGVLQPGQRLVVPN